MYFLKIAQPCSLWFTLQSPTQAPYSLPGGMDSQSITDPSGHGLNCLPSKLGTPKGSYFILGHIQSYQPLNDWVIWYSDWSSGPKWYMMPPKPKTSKRKGCFHSGSGQRGCHVPITLKVIDSRDSDFWSPRHIIVVAGPWNMWERAPTLWDTCILIGYLDHRILASCCHQSTKSVLYLTGWWCN